MPPASAFLTTFLCLSTFLSLVFQQDALNLWGEKRIDCLFYGTWEKWSPEHQTSATFGDITKCHQGISHLLRQIKQRLVSVAQLTAATQASKMAFPPLHLAVHTLSSSQQDAATSFCSAIDLEKKGPKAWIHVRVTLRPGTSSAGWWGKDTPHCSCLIPQGYRYPSAVLCVKYPSHYYTVSCFSLDVHFQINHFQKPQ